jgi:hypothetical protein
VVQNADMNAEFTRRYVDSTKWRAINMGGGYVPTTSVATGSFRVKHGYGAGVTAKSIQHSIALLSYRGLVLTELDPDGKSIIETLSAKALTGATHALVTSIENAHASAYAS